MGYTFEKWNLYRAYIKTKGNKIRKLLFFSKWTPKRGTICDLPEGFTVDVNKRTGFPFLKSREDL